MTAQNITTIIVAFIAALPAILAFFKIKEVKQDVKEVHLSLNSRLDELVRSKQEVAHAEGVKVGVKKEQERVK